MKAWLLLWLCVPYASMCKPGGHQHQSKGRSIILRSEVGLFVGGNVVSISAQCGNLTEGRNVVLRHLECLPRTWSNWSWLPLPDLLTCFFMLNYCNVLSYIIWVWHNSNIQNLSWLLWCMDASLRIYPLYHKSWNRIFSWPGLNYQARITSEAIGNFNVIIWISSFLSFLFQLFPLLPFLHPLAGGQLVPLLVGGVSTPQSRFKRSTESDFNERVVHQHWIMSVKYCLPHHTFLRAASCRIDSSSNLALSSFFSFLMVSNSAFENPPRLCKIKLKKKHRKELTEKVLTRNWFTRNYRYSQYLEAPIIKLIVCFDKTWFHLRTHSSAIWGFSFSS